MRRFTAAMLFAAMTAIAVAGANDARSSECTPEARIAPEDVQILTSADPMLNWRSLYYPDGRYVRLTVGLGSSAFRRAGDPGNSVYVLADRGPNFDCSQAKDIIGKARNPACRDHPDARFYPTPDYTPSIYRLELDRATGSFAVKDAVSLKTASGRSVSGLINPQTVAETDFAVDLQGRPLRPDPDAVDAEALVHLSDGSFWVSEEMGPSLLHVAADGRILKRFVPEGAAEDYKDAETEIVATLPAILSKRAKNRGIEALTVTPDEQYLYFMLQSPLVDPDKATYRNARNIRLFKFDLRSEQVVAEYVYTLDTPEAFGLDKDAKESELRVSEIAALGGGKLLVLERTDPRTRLYEISVDASTSNLLGTEWDRGSNDPTLEGTDRLDTVGITPVAKTLTLDTACIPGAPQKLEGMTFLGDGSLFMINDNDFGIYGAPTQAMIVKGLDLAQPIVYRPRKTYHWL